MGNEEPEGRGEAVAGVASSAWARFAPTALKVHAAARAKLRVRALRRRTIEHLGDAAVVRLS
jgi:hypothetical protein